MVQPRPDVGENERLKINEEDDSGPEARLQVRRWRCQRVHRVDLSPGVVASEASAHAQNVRGVK